MTNASSRSAGYALMIEDNPDQKIQSKRRTYAPVAFSSKLFSPAQLKMSINSKEILAIYMASLEFAHILWEATKPTTFLKTTSPSHVFSKQRQFCQHSGMHVIICCNFTSKMHTLLVQSSQQLTFSPNMSLKTRRRYV